MKRIIVIPFSQVFNNNELFNIQSRYNNDNRLSASIKLYNILTSRNFEVMTHDMVDKRSICKNDILLSYNHHPNEFRSLVHRIDKSSRILIAQEPNSKINFYQSTLSSYAKVLTWNESVLHYSNVSSITAFPITREHIDWVPVNQRKFLINISMNKQTSNNGELYSERVKAITLAEQMFQTDFDLFGIGWNKPSTFLEKLGLKKYPHFSSYRGSIKEKSGTLRYYMFSLCFENNRLMNGNISEKIFDCFQCGVIPLYWGAPDICKHIPKDLFIWREDFPSTEAMLSHLRSISVDQMESKLQKIREFLDSDRMSKFWDTTYVDTIISSINSLSETS